MYIRMQKHTRLLHQSQCGLDLGEKKYVGNPNTYRKTLGKRQLLRTPEKTSRAIVLPAPAPGPVCGIAPLSNKLDAQTQTQGQLKRHIMQHVWIHLVYSKGP